MSAKDKWVRRFSVDETAKHKNGFTIYKIKSVLFPLASPEAVTIVTVWKRYSDVQRLHKVMKSLHSGLHLRGSCPALATHSFFKRFDQEVIQERAKSIKKLLLFVAEHKLLFTSTEFVNFLQTGYPEPESSQPSSTIDSIRTSLHLPIEETPPLEYQTSDDDASRSPVRENRSRDVTDSAQNTSFNETCSNISQIQIFEPENIEIRESPKKKPLDLTRNDSYESFSSLESDIYDELSKSTLEKPKKSKQVLPDLINFDAPSTSNLRTSNTDSEMSLMTLYDRCDSRSSNALSLSDFDCKTRTESSYVFEAGYLINLAVKCEDLGDYQKAFDCYKSGIEKMLIGVKTDPDPQRRALIKDKTNKYLSHAELLYRRHLNDREPPAPTVLERPTPELRSIQMYESVLSQYRAFGTSNNIILVLHTSTNKCFAIKAIQKVPNNLTEFDEHFLQTAKDTKTPIFPKNIPYMVPLHCFVETKDLFFLILSYAPGEKLLDYIKNYIKSAPNTPAREVNLNNVFAEPKSDLHKSDELQSEKLQSELTVNELVTNSQNLLIKVDRVLNKSDGDSVKNDGGGKSETIPPPRLKLKPPPARAGALPARAASRWGAELLTAIESLHSCGVICRDLNPNNILLGDGGQILLTYFVGYEMDMLLTILEKNTKPGQVNLYLAPELYRNTFLEPEISENGVNLDHVCDFWSFGAIMYELICGVPLRHYHRSVFTRHTALQLPEGLATEPRSLLTQLLAARPGSRLGAGGVAQIKEHPYFKHIDWTSIRRAANVPA